MKLIIILGIAVFSSQFVKGQNDTAILRLAISLTQNNKINYVEQTVGWEQISSLLKKSRYHDSFPKQRNNSICLSRKERKYLLKEIEKNKQYSWSTNLFENSNLMPYDSIWNYFDKQWKRIYNGQREALIKKDTLQYKILKQEWPWVYGFSKPLYIRDYSVCILYYFRMCGNPCGKYGINFYKKINDNWVEWVKADYGDF